MEKEEKLDDFIQDFLWLAKYIYREKTINHNSYSTIQEYFEPTLKKYFPTVDFNVFGTSLASILFKEVENDSTLYELYPGSQYGATFYQRTGHMQRKEEEEKYNRAQAEKEKVEKDSRDALTTLYDICKIITNPTNDTNLDKDICERMYKYDYKLKSEEMPWLEKYYIKYSECKRLAQEEFELRVSLGKSQDKIDEQKETIESLKLELNQERETKNRLQVMLDTALQFVQKVKNSRVGNLFFRKSIKQLPEGLNSNTEIDR